MPPNKQIEWCVGTYGKSRLEAAAPDLLRALENVLSHTLATDNEPPHIVAARAAIAKARGK